MLTDPIFFDTDCISAFFWVDQENILQTLYHDRLVIPYETYSELSKVLRLKSRADAMLASKQIQLENILIGSPEFALFNELTNPQVGQKAIGSGEAACIALSYFYNGTLASNNMRDVAEFVKKFGLPHITTASILKEALNQRLITEQQGNSVWTNMLSKRRKLPYSTFSEYLHNSLHPNTIDSR